MKTANEIFLSFDKLDKERIGKNIVEEDVFNWTLIKAKEKVYVEDIINLIKEAQIDILTDLEMLILNSEDDLDRGQGKYIIQSFIDEYNKIL